MAGVSIATVCHYRQRWSIPSYRSTLAAGSDSMDVAASSHPSGVLTGQQGFSVTIQTAKGRQQHITIADDIVAAARRASAIAKGKIVEIIHLGPAIGR